MNNGHNSILLKIALFIILAFALFSMVSNAGVVDEGSEMIDIKPGSCPNAVNIGRNGVLPAAIIGSEGFDVDDVDVGSIKFAFGGEIEDPEYNDDLTRGISPRRCKVDDVNSDGIPDLIFHFPMKGENGVNALYGEFLVINPDREGDPFVPATILFKADGEEYDEESGVIFIPKLFNNGKKK